MPPNRFESEVESFLEGSHGDRTHIKRADHHTVTPLCGTLLLSTTKQTTLEGPEGAAGVPMGGGRAWPDNEPTRRTIRKHTRPHWCGGRRRDLPRCRWAVAGPGRASRRRAERSSRRGRLAGGPPPTGTHSGRGLRRPQHPWGRKQGLVSYNPTSRYAQESIRRPRPAGAGRGQQKMC